MQEYNDFSIASGFLSARCILKLGDFGLMCEVGTKGQLGHTPGYAAPEQVSVTLKLLLLLLLLLPLLLLQ